MNLPSHEQIIKQVSAEFANFKKPKDYGGGRHQTSISGVFAHCDYTGRLNRIEINKPGGSIYYLDLKHKEKRYGRYHRR